jgi:hypothetical protein
MVTESARPAKLPQDINPQLQRATHRRSASRQPRFPRGPRGGEDDIFEEADIAPKPLLFSENLTGLTDPSIGEVLGI